MTVRSGPKLFSGRPKSEFGGHPATQDANTTLKYTDRTGDFWQ